MNPEGASASVEGDADRANSEFTAQAVSANAALTESPDGIRLVGGSVELGESHRDAIMRECGAEICG